MSGGCPRCGLSVPNGALGVCPRCLLQGDESEPTPESPPGLERLEPIGRGGMGRVFRARHARLDRLVAVKFLAVELDGDTGIRQRFEREARLLARLNHPHIVTVYDFGALADGSGYLVMEYMPGGTLRERLPLSIEAVESVTRELVSALAYAHAEGVVHRDIKPENVLFDAEGRLKVADFGIAGLLGEQTSLTAPQQVLGTPRYMAPEARLGESRDPRVDVFAIGVMLQEMLGSVEHARLSPIAERACAADPRHRYASAVELRHALDALDAGLLVALPPDERSWLRAVALTLAGATAVSIYAVLISVTPRVLEATEALPFIVFDAQPLAGGRLATRARFETWPTLGAAAAWAVAFLAHGALRQHWRRAGLLVVQPDRPLGAVRRLWHLALVLNLLFGLHLLLETTSYRPVVIYLPILGGVLELGMVYLVWTAVLEAELRARPLRREPVLWLAAAASLIPPVVASYRLWRGGQP